MNKRNLLCILILLLASSLMHAQKVNTEILTGMDNSKIIGDTIQLERKTYNAFIKMKDAAEKDGIKIKLVSGFRDFYRQQIIWNNKYKKFTKEFLLDGPSAIKEIIRFSTIPGTSRHHWGTEIDVIDKIIPEPIGGAHRNQLKAIQDVGDVIEENLKFLSNQHGNDLKHARQERYLQIGRSGLFSDKTTAANSVLDEKFGKVKKRKNLKLSLIVKLLFSLTIIALITGFLFYFFR
mgnify:CR=1 FL=1